MRIHRVSLLIVCNLKSCFSDSAILHGSLNSPLAASVVAKAKHAIGVVLVSSGKSRFCFCSHQRGKKRNPPRIRFFVWVCWETMWLLDVLQVVSLCMTKVELRLQGGRFFIVLLSFFSHKELCFQHRASWRISVTSECTKQRW